MKVPRAHFLSFFCLSTFFFFLMTTCPKLIFVHTFIIYIPRYLQTLNEKFKNYFPCKKQKFKKKNLVTRTTLSQRETLKKTQGLSVLLILNICTLFIAIGDIIIQNFGHAQSRTTQSLPEIWHVIQQSSDLLSFQMDIL